MHLSSEVFSGLVEQIYLGVTEPSGWQTFLDSLTETVNAGASGIHTINTSAPRGEAVIAQRFDPAFVRSYERYYSTVNPRVIHGRHLLKEGNVVLSGMQYPDEQMSRSEFYTDWLQPQDLFHSAGVVILDDHQVTSNLTIFRSREAGAFDANEQELLRQLFPHLRRAVRLRRELVNAETHKRTAVDALDRIAIPIILLNRRGRIVLANRAGLEVLRRGDSLVSTPEGVSTVDRYDARELKALIDRTVLSRSDRNVVGGGSIQVSRSTGTSVTVMVVPFMGNPEEFDEVPAVGLYLSDSGCGAAGSESYQRMFGLTAAESRVAAMIARGMTMEQVGDEIHLSTNTVRSHMKSIFNKVGVNRQPDLMRILMATPRTRND